MENIMLDPAQNRHLNDKGYVKHQLLSESEILCLLDEVYKYYAEHDFLPNGHEDSHAHITTSYTHDGVSVREHISDVVRKILSPKIDQLLNDYRILACGLFVKAPKGGWLDLHYHPTVVEDPRHWVIDIRPEKLSFLKIVCSTGPHKTCRILLVTPYTAPVFRKM